MLLRFSWMWLPCLLVAGAAMPARAEGPADPLRLVPARAALVAKIENPSAILHSVYDLKAFQDVQKIDAVKEFLGSTNVGRFNQLVHYFENKLSTDKFGVLDKVAGGGVVFALKIEKKPKVLLIVQGKDAKATKEFVDLSLDIIKKELVRQEKKEKIERATYNGVRGYHIGKKLYLAVAGRALIFSNHVDALKASINLQQHKGGKDITSNKNLRRARKMLAPHPEAWAWLDLEKVRRIPKSKEFFNATTKPGALALNFTFMGGMIDVAGRAPFVVAGFYHKGNRFTYTVRMPRGLKGMHDKVAGLFPTKQQKPLPLLEPPHVLSSSSFYLDLGKFWKNRGKLMNEQQRKRLEKFDQNSGRFLGGVKLSQLFEKSGSQYRFVITQPSEPIYKNKKPQQKLQAYGLVHKMRDPSLGRSLDRMLRAVAILGAAKFNVKMVEEKHGDVTLVTYRFPEDGELKQDKGDIRFNFTPCFAQVGNQFLVASTVELGRDLITCLQHEQKRKAGHSLMHAKLYSAGLAVALESNKEQLVTQFVLGQAQPIDQARKQVDQLIDLVRGLGTADIETIYQPNDFRMNIVVRVGK